MSTQLADPVPARDDAALPRRRFTAAEVLRMVESGVLAEDEPVELLAGELVVVSPQGPGHSGWLTAMQDRLRRLYGRPYTVRPQLPLDAGRTSLPEPDLAVVPSRPSGWRDRHPKGREAVLVLEIAASSQKLDRAKAAIYARSGVRVYWILDLAARRLEVRTEPRSDGSYAVTVVLAGRDSVPLPGLRGKAGGVRRVRVSSLLP